MGIYGNIYAKFGTKAVVGVSSVLTTQIKNDISYELKMKNLKTKSILLWLLMLYSLPFHSRADATTTAYTVDNSSHTLVTTVTDALHCRQHIPTAVA